MLFFTKKVAKCKKSRQKLIHPRNFIDSGGVSDRTQNPIFYYAQKACKGKESRKNEWRPLYPHAQQRPMRFIARMVFRAGLWWACGQAEDGWGWAMIMPGIAARPIPCDRLIRTTEMVLLPDMEAGSQQSRAMG